MKIDFKNLWLTFWISTLMWIIIFVFWFWIKYEKINSKFELMEIKIENCEKTKADKVEIEKINTRLDNIESLLLEVRQDLKELDKKI